jgi:hypothetical protein
MSGQDGWTGLRSSWMESEVSSVNEWMSKSEDAEGPPTTSDSSQMFNSGSERRMLGTTGSSAENALSRSVWWRMESRPST